MRSFLFFKYANCRLVLDGNSEARQLLFCGVIYLVSYFSRVCRTSEGINIYQAMQGFFSFLTCEKLKCAVSSNVSVFSRVYDPIT